MDNKEIAKAMLPWVKLLAEGNELEWYDPEDGEWWTMSDPRSLYHALKDDNDIRIVDNSHRIEEIKSQIEDLTDELEALALQQHNSPNEAREGA
jgi:hypothetical protein